jgi:rhodanese-related sulfurtransferase
MNIAEIIKYPDASLIDVRSVEEFEEGSVPGAINIPLLSVPEKLEEIKSLNKPVIVFFRSGARSHQATNWLKQNGVAV